MDFNDYIFPGEILKEKNKSSLNIINKNDSSTKPNFKNNFTKKLQNLKVIKSKSFISSINNEKNEENDKINCKELLKECENILKCI